MYNKILPNMVSVISIYCLTGTVLHSALFKVECFCQNIDMVQYFVLQVLDKSI